jgi:hypothetical protein
MFDKLKTKWNVNGTQLLLIFCTFALGGTICGRGAKKILELLPLEKGVLWVVVYLLLVTLLWPLAVILVSIPLGQFSFFKNYVSKIIRRMSGRG